MSKGASKAKPGKTIKEARSQIKYRGKIVIEINGEIYSASSGPEASQIIKKLKKENPNKTPTITYLPKENESIVPTLVSMEGEASVKKGTRTLSEKKCVEEDETKKDGD